MPRGYELVDSVTTQFDRTTGKETAELTVTNDGIAVVKISGVDFVYTVTKNSDLYRGMDPNVITGNFWGLRPTYTIDSVVAYPTYVTINVSTGDVIKVQALSASAGGGQVYGKAQIALYKETNGIIIPNQQLKAAKSIIYPITAPGQDTYIMSTIHPKMDFYCICSGIALITVRQTSTAEEPFKIYLNDTCIINREKVAYTNNGSLDFPNKDFTFQIPVAFGDIISLVRYDDLASPYFTFELLPYKNEDIPLQESSQAMGA